MKLKIVSSASFKQLLVQVKSWKADIFLSGQGREEVQVGNIQHFTFVINWKPHKCVSVLDTGYLSQPYASYITEHNHLKSLQEKEIK